MKVVKAVEQLKQKLSKQNLSDSTKRSKITSFIAQKGSRQEFETLLGKIIDWAHVDPLHLKNNVCALAHRYLLNEVICFLICQILLKCFLRFLIILP